MRRELIFAAICENIACVGARMVERSNASVLEREGEDAARVRDSAAAIFSSFNVYDSIVGRALG